MGKNSHFFLAKFIKNNIKNYGHVTKIMIYFITNCIHIIQKTIMHFAKGNYFLGSMHKKRNNERRLRQLCQS